MIQLNFLLLLILSSISVFADSNSPGKTIDLGQLEIEGELRRPNVQWLDSQKRLKEYVSRIYAEQFHHLEDELLKPMTHSEFESELKKEDNLVSN